MKLNIKFKKKRITAGYQSKSGNLKVQFVKAEKSNFSYEMDEKMRKNSWRKLSRNVTKKYGKDGKMN